MRVIVVVLVAAAAAIAGGLRMSVSDAADPVPLQSRVEPAKVSPVPGGDDLPIMPGWPKQVSSSANFGPARGVALADFDGDGRMEVIMPSTANQLHVWKYDGTYYPGWPRTLSGMGQYAAAVADIDLDGDYEIAVCTRGMTSGGVLAVFREDGTAEAGWPYSGRVGGNFSDSPTLADVNGDDTLELIAGERNYPTGYLHVLNCHGTELSGWPYSLDHVPAMGAAVGDIDSDGSPEIIYASYNSLYALNPDGTLVPGWPQTNPNGGYFSYQSPALADVDSDDTLEIVVAEHRDGSGAYVFRHDGTILSGWPFRFARWTYCPPTACDLYRNGELKVLCGQSGIVGGAAQVFYAFDAGGTVLPGFPITQPNGDAAEGNTAVADLDEDGDMEAIFSSNIMVDNKGFMYAVHHDGSAVTNWPLRPGGFTYQNGATVADVDADDSLDIVVVADNGGTTEVTVYEAGVPFNRAAWEWPTYQFDMQRTGLYQPYQTGVAEASRTGDVRLTVTPNPFRHRVAFSLPAGARARLVIADASGRSVRRLTTAGSVAWDGADEHGRRVPAGVYLYRLVSGDSETAGMLLRVE